jgi:hypothetical protein
MYNVFLILINGIFLECLFTVYNNSHELLQLSYNSVV